MVTELIPDGPASEAGVRVHDVVIRVQDTLIGSEKQLAELLKDEDDKTLDVELLRGGEVVALTIRPRRDGTDLSDFYYLSYHHLHNDRFLIGVNLSEADETLRSQLGLDEGIGWSSPM